jgi:hypothetical protein
MPRTKGSKHLRGSKADFEAYVLGIVGSAGRSGVPLFPIAARGALRTPTARRMLRGCRRENQVLIFLSEADLPLKSQFRDLGLLGAPSIWQPRNWL